MNISIYYVLNGGIELKIDEFIKTWEKELMFFGLTLPLRIVIAVINEFIEKEG